MGSGIKRARAEMKADAMQQTAIEFARRNESLRKKYLRMTLFCIVALYGWGAMVIWHNW